MSRRVSCSRLSSAKRLLSAAETLMAARVAETQAWKDGADRSAAHWLARRTGTSIAEAKAKLETAERLADLPATAEAFRAGRLSDQQAREVVAGAVADPESEQRLLGTAAEDSLGELRNESRRAQAVDGGEERQRKIHRAAVTAGPGRLRRHLSFVVLGHRARRRADSGRVEAVHRPTRSGKPTKKDGSSRRRPMRPTGSQPWPLPRRPVTAPVLRRAT